jgi:hypothetical protein
MPRQRGNRLDSRQFADIGGKAAIKSRKASSRGPVGTHMAGEMTKFTSGRLIAAKKFLGTDVCGMQGEKLCTIENIMIDKLGGTAICAIL